jgi:hypothetical protein
MPASLFLSRIALSGDRSPARRWQLEADAAATPSIGGVIFGAVGDDMHAGGAIVDLIDRLDGPGVATA